MQFNRTAGRTEFLRLRIHRAFERAGYRSRNRRRRRVHQIKGGGRGRRGIRGLRHPRSNQPSRIPPGEGDPI
ncbi:hypothetical protein [Klebsiella phage vB_KshKPC-M]|nr:hypothetical protein [Klebsiella phage vB_KshKPC-M]